MLQTAPDALVWAADDTDGLHFVPTTLLQVSQSVERVDTEFIGAAEQNA